MYKSILRFALAFVLISVGMISCEKDAVFPDTMKKAEVIMTTYPDSALSLLRRMNDTINEMPVAVRMCYNLLLLKAEDKCHISQTSDSLINQIINYYQSKEDKNRLVESYYMKGRICRDLQDAPKALKYFQKALELNIHNSNYSLLSRIYMQIGYLYSYQDVFESAIPMFQNALYYMNLDKDSISMPFPLRDIARIYNVNGERDSAVYYYLNAYELSHKVGNTRTEYTSLSELGGTYLDMELYDLALNSLYNSLEISLDYNPYAIYEMFGELYMKINQLDSSRYYLNKSLKSSDIYIKSGAYSSLLLLEENSGNYKEAVKYNQLYRQSQDSIRKITSSETIRKMKSLYDYSQAEKENIVLRLDNSQKKIYIYRLVLCMIFISLIVLSYIQYERKKKKDILLYARKLEQLKEEQYKESLDYIEENKLKIKKMESELDLAEKDNDKMRQELISAQKEMLEIINRQILVHNKEQQTLIEDFKSSDIYLKFHLLGLVDNIKFTEDDWLQLQKSIDDTYCNFTNRLYALYPKLSIIELRICYMIKISVTVTNMAIFLNRSKSTISSSRNRLYKKLCGQEGTPDMLDAFLFGF